MIVKCEGAFVETEVDGEVVLMNVTDGSFYSLDGPALAIWRALDGARSVEDIAAMLAGDYDEQADVIEEHVNEFVNTLADAGLVRAADTA